MENFLPKYPLLDDDSKLDPYDTPFNEVIFRKKEFFENKLDKQEEFPSIQGDLTKYQKTIVRYLSSYTPYIGVLLVHEPGTGKSCAAIGAVEHIRHSSNDFTGALVLASGDTMLANFTNEIVFKCTSGEYIPKEFSTLNARTKLTRINKNVREFYSLQTFQKFSKHLKNTSDEGIISQYSNKIVVIDEVHHLRIKEGEEKEDLDIYLQIHRLLHLIQNSKVLLLSGTPMQDIPEEVASIMNLLLPKDEQLPMGREFREEFIENSRIKPDKIDELKKKFMGRVSFLRESPSNVKKRYIGEVFPPLDHFVVHPTLMSKFQTKNYKLAHAKDKLGQGGVGINAQEASLFVYPDGSFGREGFATYIQTRKIKSSVFSSVGADFVMKEELRTALVGNTDAETLINVRKHSCVYADVIEKILSTKGNCFIYSSIVEGSGCILFSLILKLFGFSQADGKETTRSPRYALLIGATSSTLTDIKERFNKVDNYKGGFIRVIVGSNKIAEGYSFNCMVFEAILTPHWNYSETIQAIARGIRFGSHNELIKHGLNPDVEIMQCLAVPDSKSAESIQLKMYKISEDKDIVIRSILRLMMESAFDCALNYRRNKLDGEEGTRECDYKSCEFQCDGISPDLLVEENPQLDYSTYNLYYSNTITPLRKRIDDILRFNRIITINNLIDNLKNEFNAEEVISAVSTITDEGNVNYADFLLLYSDSPSKVISNTIEEMFRTTFEITLNEIVEVYDGKYTRFEILQTLSKLISDNTAIMNKFGFYSYIRENNNTYFLVDNMPTKPTLFSSYYSENPSVMSSTNFTQLLITWYENKIPELITRICNAETEIEFATLINNLSVEYKELILEAVVLAKLSNVQGKERFIRFVSNYFDAYIKTVGGITVSTLLKTSKNVSRCLTNQTWSDCTPELIQRLKREEDKETTEMAASKHGIIGLRNPQTKKFCLIDHMKNPVQNDARTIRAGKVCSSWDPKELIQIIDRMEIPVKITKSREDMIKQVQESKYASKIFTTEEIEGMSLSRLAILTKYITATKATMCDDIYAQLDSEGRIKISDTCGERGKPKGLAVIENSGHTSFVPTRYILSQMTEDMKAQFIVLKKLLIKIADESGIKDMTNRLSIIGDNRNDVWLIYNKKKTVIAFMHLKSKESETTIEDLSIAKSVQEKELVVDLLTSLRNDITRQTDYGGRPITGAKIILDKQSANYKKRHAFFKKIGLGLPNLVGNLEYYSI